MRRLFNRTQVDKLPDEAISVAKYAKTLGVTAQAIYNQVRKGKNHNYDIIMYEGYNFILPKKEIL